MRKDAWKDPTYVCHLLEPKEKALYELSSKAQELAGITDGDEVNFYLDNGTSRNIAESLTLSLEEYGVTSGSIFIVERLSKREGSHSKSSSDRTRQGTPDPDSDKEDDKDEDCDCISEGENPDDQAPLNLGQPTMESQPTTPQNNVPDGASQNAPAGTTMADSRSTSLQNPDPLLNVTSSDVTQNAVAPVRAQASVVENSAAKASTEDIAEEEKSWKMPKSKQAMMSSSAQQPFSNEAQPISKVKNKGAENKASFEELRATNETETSEMKARDAACKADEHQGNEVIGSPQMHDTGKGGHLINDALLSKSAETEMAGNESTENKLVVDDSAGFSSSSTQLSDHEDYVSPVEQERDLDSFRNNSSGVLD